MYANLFSISWSPGRYLCLFFVLVGGGPLKGNLQQLLPGFVTTKTQPKTLFNLALGKMNEWDFRIKYVR